MLAEGAKSSIRVRRAAALKRHLLLLLSEIISAHLFISFSCRTPEPYGGNRWTAMWRRKRRAALQMDSWIYCHGWLQSIIRILHCHMMMIYVYGAWT